ncbi:hypothetical protein [Thermodesulfovibrio sp. TK110]
MVAKVAEKFKKKYCQISEPIFLKTYGDNIFLARAKKKENSYFEYIIDEDVSIELKNSYTGHYTVNIKTSLEFFDDHFETFVSEIASLIYPKVEVKEKKD